MSKLMEIIEKSPDFEKGTATLRFLDTTFSQLTRKIGSKTGADFKTAKARDALSKELLISLNKEQLLLKDKLILWQQSYNAWINSIKGKITGATNFEYNFTSLIDYSSKYVVNKTLADYYLLTEVINAEKELYEFGHYWGRNHMVNIQNQMKEWSKTKLYGSSVDTIELEYEVGSSGFWELQDTAGLNVVLDGYNRHDKRWLSISGLEKIKIGETKTIRIKATAGAYNGKAYALCYFSIKKNTLNSNYDDGYFVLNAWGTSHGGDNWEIPVYYFDKVRTWPRVKKWTGKSSPHFDTDNISLAWIKSRVLI
ncbi:hypothetical protein [Fusobacterium ulcerans]|uniref:hypothetical protein n=1 Tax=Fusobacterium ulcerans TaxID=861 RepID=UPI0030ACC1C5